MRPGKRHSWLFHCVGSQISLSPVPTADTQHTHESPVLTCTHILPHLYPCVYHIHVWDSTHIHALTWTHTWKLRIPLLFLTGDQSTYQWPHCGLHLEREQKSPNVSAVLLLPLHCRSKGCFRVMPIKWRRVKLIWKLGLRIVITLSHINSDKIEPKVRMKSTVFFPKVPFTPCGQNFWPLWAM